MHSRRNAITAIVAKDVSLFARDRFYLLVTLLGLVFYILVFWLLPGSVDETIRLGVHLPGVPVGAVAGGLDLSQGGAEAGVEVVSFQSADALERAVAGEGDEPIEAGLDFPDDFLTATAAGEPTTVRVVVPADVGDELRAALAGLVRELAFQIAGTESPVTPPAQDDVVIGVDRAGAQISLREQMRPLLALLILVVETTALASLVAVEIQERTIAALLVTPARAGDVLAAKAILGTLLAFLEVLILTAAIGTLATNPGLIVVVLLLGAVLVTGFGLLAGSAGRDFLGTVFFSIVFMVPLAIPAIAALFPGGVAWWIQALPSYGFVQAIVGASVYGESWAELWSALVLLCAWCVAAFAAGLAVLGRRVARS